jgi:hypothetical protein
MTKMPSAIFAVALIATYGSGAVLAQTPGIHPKRFDSPDEAVKALIDAASKNDKSELTAILGSAAQGVLTSGDATQDQEERREFSRLASAKNHIEHSSMNSASAVLLIGDEDWPFPIPLVRTGQQWHFDPELGVVETRARRIGANELDAIEICMGYVSAQEEYAAQRPSGTGSSAYAQKIMSSPGGKDGLYQPGAAQELVPEGLAMADAGSRDRERKPYHGYYFRVLKEQGPNAPGGAHRYIAGGAMIGGFALLAWPAEYGVTGIHTFIVSHDGDVFEKDFGPKTANITPPIVTYDPDSSWNAVN